MTDPMEAEFDLVAEWTRQAVLQLGEDHALPAACQGSASPAALDWLGAACGVTAGTRLLDVGGGTGGPAAYAAQEFGARPLLVEPMPGACRTARELFGLPVVVGTGEALPVATGAAQAVWCLGVLCTTPHRPALLRELRRVLTDDGDLGLLVFERCAARLPDTPEGNDFPTAAELDRQLHAAGFVVADRTPYAELAPAPRSWSERADRVSAAVAAEHGADPRYRTARDQQERIAKLLDDGAIGGELVHVRAVT
jgi:ubiquinone/menaquinone biosynthesis C-methylase UbiE